MGIFLRVWQTSRYDLGEEPGLVLVGVIGTRKPLMSLENVVIGARFLKDSLHFSSSRSVSMRPGRRSAVASRSARLTSWTS